MAKRKKGMTFIPYDYEAAYNKSLEDMHEFFVEQMFKHGKYYKALYDQAGNSIAVPIFESIFRKIILQEVA